jgi:hypothetical protein
VNNTVDLTTATDEQLRQLQTETNQAIGRMKRDLQLQQRFLTAIRLERRVRRRSR